MTRTDDSTASVSDRDVAARRAQITPLASWPGPIADRVAAIQAAASDAAARLWSRDAALWSDDAGVQQKIAARLGWLGSPALMGAAAGRLQTFAQGIQRDGFTDVVLLGMGGSSLAPEVLRSIVGVADGWPRLHMLDSTDPASVLAIDTVPKETLYVLASKSGTTIEPNSLAAYFRSELERAGIRRWGTHFVAITDEGTELARRARRDAFREVFINPSDIGGRYSALSFFGLVPAALMGQDVSSLVAWGLAMLAACEEGGDPARNPGVGLGLAMAAAAKAGRDKLTLLFPPKLEALGLWIEQLVAESTGKHGVGIVPISGEAPAPIDAYGADRFMVTLTLGSGRGDTGGHPDDQALRAAGLPGVSLGMPEPTALGAEFVRWEVATAIAGALLAINPFDEPNVQQAKDATRMLLDGYKREGRLPQQAADATLEPDITLTMSDAARAALGSTAVEHFLQLVGPNDYVALLAYLGPDAALAEVLRAWRAAIGVRTRAATMFGYGPRYLHSTGQLHKGGANNGVFIVITAVPAIDIAIPGEAFSFGTLELAQGLGDFASLGAAGRRALHIHLPSPEPTLVTRAAAALVAGLPPQ